MKALLQNIKSGKRYLGEMPYPAVSKGRMLVETQYSAVSIGTEKMVMELASMNYLQKAKARPDDVKKILGKIRQEGLWNTYKSVMNRLDEPMMLGYSASGVIADVSPEIGDFKKGDRVAIGGGGFASHSEVNLVPQNLAVKLPDNVDMADASLSTIAAIGIQGMRMAEVEPGEYVCVIGLGLLGLLTCQVLMASGCRVFGIEPDSQKRELAQSLGVEKAFDTSEDSHNIFTHAKGRGFDKIIITASTKSDETVATAGEIARDRAIISAVGAVGMNIPRNVYYMKELDFRVSRSYGAGRYDNIYEEKGIDYPIGYVRWTEQRNMEFFIDLLEQEKIDVKPLISRIASFDSAVDIYDEIMSDKGKDLIGVILKYTEDIERDRTIQINTDNIEKADKVRAGIIGAGNFVRATMLPALQANSKYALTGIADRSGKNSAIAGRKYGFKYATSDYKKMLDDESVNLIVVATGHASHAGLVSEALLAGKDVYCEKPLAITVKQLNDVKNALKGSGKRLFVGYNRRFSPHIQYIKDYLGGLTKPYQMVYMMNAGFIPKDHWVNDPAQGGRIIGEGCHILDLFVYITDSSIKQVHWVNVTGDREDMSYESESTLLFEFEDGSMGTLVYSAMGSKEYPKEEMRIFAGSSVITMNNYKETKIYSERGNKKFKTSGISKGFDEAYEALAEAVLKGKDFPIPIDEIMQIEHILR